MAKSKSTKVSNGKSNGVKTMVLHTVTAPAAVGTQKKGAKPPSMSYDMDGGCRIRHSEFMFDLSIENSSVPTITSYTINPQRAQVFTWLTAIATRFEMYKFNKLKFVYKPSCSTNTDGYIALGFDFDFYDSAPVKSTLLAWKYSNKTVPWSQTSLDVSTDSRLSTYRYNNYDSSNGDARLDFLGNLWIILAANTGTYNPVGEMYVEYDVSFRQPSYKIPPALYGEFSSEPIVGATTEVFNKIAKSLGNILYEKISNNKIRIKDVCDIIVTLGTAITGGTFASAPSITVSGPLSSNWVEEDMGVVTNAAANGSLTSRHITINTAPVDIVFNASTAGGSVINRVVMSTFAETYSKLFT